MSDVVSLGELLIDFTPYGESDTGNQLFEKNPGGAPANVLAMLAKLGISTSFIGKVGNDQFGNFLKSTLVKENIDTSGLVFSREVNTTLAFVHLNPSGDRSFSFYRNPGADVTLEESEVKYDLIENSKVFHFGSLSMTSEPARQATYSALKFAKEKGLLITYDPNLRESLWADMDEAKRLITKGLGYTDVLKVSEDELMFLTDTKDYVAGSELLMKEYDIPLIFVTLGDKGCFFRYNDITETIPSFKVDVVDTTGSGDAFFGSILYRIIKGPNLINDLTKDTLKSYVSFANAAGALVTTKRGSIPALPALDEINKLQNQQQ